MTGRPRLRQWRTFVPTALAGLLFAATIIGPIYAVTVGPRRLVVRRWRVAPAGWPAGRRLTVALVSDPHVGGPHMRLGRLRRIVDRANALRPDLILIPGDVMASDLAAIPPVPLADAAAALGELDAPSGVWAVLGNHDWWDDPAAQARGGGPVAAGEALRAAGIPVLENEARRIDTGAGPVWIAGLTDQEALKGEGSALTGLDDLDGTLAQVTDDAPILLMAHEPDIFPRVPARVALTVSGHTHGGQMRFGPWMPYVPSRYGSRYAYGHIREDGRDLVVSGGLGCSGLPIRFGRPPEITVIELTAPGERNPSHGFI
ncbi:MAG: metallophosphoesterase [Pseudomonadota bacterium]